MLILSGRDVLIANICSCTLANACALLRASSGGITFEWGRIITELLICLYIIGIIAYFEHQHIKQSRPELEYHTVQTDARAEYYRLCQAQGLEGRQEKADRFADLLEQGKSAIEAFNQLHGER
jgi:hypothetical protein